MMNRGQRLIVAAAATIVALSLPATGSAQQTDFKWPKLLVIGTSGTAGGSFASTNGWAPILQAETGITVRIVPEDNEPQRYRRLVDRRDIAISSVSTAEISFQTEAIGGYAVTKPAAQRIIWHHNDTPWSFVVAGDSDIRTMADLKRGGVRVAEGVFAPTMSITVRNALPGFLGVPVDQAEQVFRFVPASSYAENCRSVVEGKADVAFCSPVSSLLSEMEGAPGGIRWLSMDNSDKEAWDGYLEHRPTHIPANMEIGVNTARGVDGLVSNFIYAVTPDASEDLVYNLAKFFHTSYDKYKNTHPLAARMSLEQFRKYLDHSPLPVHEGTVRYLREIGAWSDSDDAWNKQAIEKMDQWVAGHEAAMQEARDKGVRIDFQNEEFMAIVKQHTEGLERFRTRL